MANKTPLSLWASFFPRTHARLSPRLAKIQATRTYQVGSAAWRNKRWIIIGGSLVVFTYNYQMAKLRIQEATRIRPNTYLVWKFYPGSIVETRTPTSIVSFVSSKAAPGQINPQVITLFEAIQALNNAAEDAHIRGLIADFSAINRPINVSTEPLGLAQIEELQMAIHNFQVAKMKQFPRPKGASTETKKVQSGDDVPADATQDGPIPHDDIDDRPATIAFADTFESQSAYLLASSFEKVYLQPTGSVPLTGLVSQVPFFARLLDKLGIKANATARREFKSMISSATQEEGLTKPQLENQAELMGELNRSMAYSIGVRRFPYSDPREAADYIAEIMSRGPFTARQGKERGLIDDVMYKADVYKTINSGQDADPFSPSENGMKLSPEDNAFEESFEEFMLTPKEARAPFHEVFKGMKERTVHFKTLPQYSARLQSTLATLPGDSVVDIAALYLRGTISSVPAKDSASAVVKGIREAALDDKIKVIVLRIDSGGGDVVASETVWDAIRQTRQASNKPVLVSFGNVAASGAYYAATAADWIYASETTVTGSIGVAGMSPTVSRKVLDQIGVAFQTFYTGAKGGSLFHELDADQKVRREEHIDEIYADFLQKVIDGRGVSPDRVEEIAGGRVFTGLVAWSKTRPPPPVMTPEMLEAQRALIMADEAFSAQHVVRLVEAALGVKASQGATIEGDRFQSSFAMSNQDPGAFEPDHLTEWDVCEVNGPEELNALRIIKNKEGRSGDVSADSADAKIEEIVTVSSAQVDTSIDTAEAAHLEATFSREQDDQPGAADQAAASAAASVPFGRGLLDGIGGMWDIALHAASLTLLAETQALAEKKKVSFEQAQELIRPGAREREGSHLRNIAIRLRTYPREKTFRERWMEVVSGQGPGDSASMSHIVGDLWLAVKNEMSTLMAQALVKAVNTFAQDPTAAMAELSKKLEAGMASQNHNKFSMEYDGARPQC